jgi:CRP/FNR family transcriptional regulator, cyclic AMP receptor protein
METLERVLEQHGFFNDLEPEYLKLLVRCASNVRFDAGTYLFREDQEANHFYLIREGRVALEVCAPQLPPIVIATFDGGEVFGWSWLVAPYLWHCDARAVQLTRAIALDGKCLRAKCDENPALGYKLLKRVTHVMEQQLNATQEQLLDIYGARR